MIVACCKKKKGCIRLQEVQQKKKAKRGEMMVLATCFLDDYPYRDQKNSRISGFYQRPIPLNAEQRKESTAEDLTSHFDFLVQHQIKELKQKLQAIANERENALLKVSRANNNALLKELKLCCKGVLKLQNKQNLVISLQWKCTMILLLHFTSAR